MKKLSNYQKLKERLTSDTERLRSQLSASISEAEVALQKLRGKRLHIGVAGMSGSGKSSFITGLLAQLESGNASELTGFNAILEGRIKDVEVVAQEGGVRFDYPEQKQRFINGQYPSSTIEATEVQLNIRYVKRSGRESTLELIISDFPGEWLMDVALLSMDYAAWNQWQCALWYEDAKQQGLLEVFAHEQIAATITLPEILTAHLKEFIASRRSKQALSINTPGRLAIAGADVQEGAIPIPCFDWRQGEDEVLDDFLNNRYERYKKEYVEAFFNQSIRPIDRQLI